MQSNDLLHTGFYKIIIIASSSSIYTTFRKHEPLCWISKGRKVSCFGESTPTLDGVIASLHLQQQNFPNSEEFRSSVNLDFGGNKLRYKDWHQESIYAVYTKKK